MKLKRLSISNCNWVEDLEIEVRHNLVIIGPNGSGKTTVLLCLEMLLGMDDQCLCESIAEDFIRDKTKPLFIEAALDDLRADELAVFAEEVDTHKGNELLIRLEASIRGTDVIVSHYFPNCKDRRHPTQAQQNAIGWVLLDAQSSAMAIFDALPNGANILAIDEPEAHLHPSSQRSLAKLLKQEAGQKIIVTHSPTIAGSFEPDEIVVIRADGFATQPKRGFLNKESSMTVRWWVGRRLEPLTAGIVVAVEGPSDRIIVNRVADVLGIDLDERDIVVVETDGCGNMRVVESIFGSGGFNIPLFELVDDDNREDIARRIGADPTDLADLAAHHVFISCNDLEDEYVHAIGAKKLWEKIKAMKTFSKTAMRQCKRGPDGSPSEADLAEFIRVRTSRKIPSALVAASHRRRNAPKVPHQCDPGERCPPEVSKRASRRDGEALRLKALTPPLSNQREAIRGRQGRHERLPSESAELLLRLNNNQLYMLF